MADTAAQQQILERLDALLIANAAEADGTSWELHDDRISAIMDATSALYLRTVPNTGELLDRQIWPSFEPGAEVYNLGCWAMMVRPLVEMLDAQTKQLEPLRPAMDSQTKADFDDWKKRLAVYVAEVAAAPQDQPDKDVWLRVSAPLFTGYYPADFKSMGIINPSVKSAPDVIRPTTLSFQSAITDQRGQWTKLWGEKLRKVAAGFVVGAGGLFVADTAVEAVETVTETVETLTQTGRNINKLAVGGAVVLGLGYLGFQLLGRRR